MRKENDKQQSLLKNQNPGCMSSVLDVIGLMLYWLFRLIRLIIEVVVTIVALIVLFATVLLNPVGRWYSFFAFELEWLRTESDDLPYTIWLSAARQLGIFICDTALTPLCLMTCVFAPWRSYRAFSRIHTEFNSDRVQMEFRGHILKAFFKFLLDYLGAFLGLCIVLAMPWRVPLVGHELYRRVKSHGDRATAYNRPYHWKIHIIQHLLIGFVDYLCIIATPVYFFTPEVYYKAQSLLRTIRADHKRSEWLVGDHFWFETRVQILLGALLSIVDILIGVVGWLACVFFPWRWSSMYHSCSPLRAILSEGQSTQEHGTQDPQNLFVGEERAKLFGHGRTGGWKPPAALLQTVRPGDEVCCRRREPPLSSRIDWRLVGLVNVLLGLADVVTVVVTFPALLSWRCLHFYEAVASAAKESHISGPTYDDWVTDPVYLATIEGNQVVATATGPDGADTQSSVVKVERTHYYRNSVEISANEAAYLTGLCRMSHRSWWDSALRPMGGGAPIAPEGMAISQRNRSLSVSDLAGGPMLWRWALREAAWMQWLHFLLDCATLLIAVPILIVTLIRLPFACIRVTIVARDPEDSNHSKKGAYYCEYRPGLWIEAIKAIVFLMAIPLAVLVLVTMYRLPSVKGDVDAVKRAAMKKRKRMSNMARAIHSSEEDEMAARAAAEAGGPPRRRQATGSMMVMLSPDDADTAARAVPPAPTSMTSVGDTGAPVKDTAARAVAAPAASSGEVAAVTPRRNSAAPGGAQQPLPASKSAAGVASDDDDDDDDQYDDAALSQAVQVELGDTTYMEFIGIVIKHGLLVLVDLPCLLLVLVVALLLTRIVRLYRTLTDVPPKIRQDDNAANYRRWAVVKLFVYSVVDWFHMLFLWPLITVLAPPWRIVRLVRKLIVAAMTPALVPPVLHASLDAAEKSRVAVARRLARINRQKRRRERQQIDQPSAESTAAPLTQPVKGSAAAVLPTSSPPPAASSSPRPTDLPLLLSDYVSLQFVPSIGIRMLFTALPASAAALCSMNGMSLTEMRAMAHFAAEGSLDALQDDDLEDGSASASTLNTAFAADFDRQLCETLSHVVFPSSRDERSVKGFVHGTQLFKELQSSLSVAAAHRFYRHTPFDVVIEHLNVGTVINDLPPATGAACGDGARSPSMHSGGGGRTGLPPGTDTASDGSLVIVESVTSQFSAADFRPSSAPQGSLQAASLAMDAQTARTLLTPESINGPRMVRVYGSLLFTHPAIQGTKPLDSASEMWDSLRCLSAFQLTMWLDHVIHAEVGSVVRTFLSLGCSGYQIASNLQNNANGSFTGEELFARPSATLSRAFGKPMATIDEVLLDGADAAPTSTRTGPMSVFSSRSRNQQRGGLRFRELHSHVPVAQPMLVMQADLDHMVDGSWLVMDYIAVRHGRHFADSLHYATWVALAQSLFDFLAICMWLLTHLFPPRALLLYFDLASSFSVQRKFDMSTRTLAEGFLAFHKKLTLAGSSKTTAADHRRTDELRPSLLDRVKLGSKGKASTDRFAWGASYSRQRGSEFNKDLIGVDIPGISISSSYGGGDGQAALCTRMEVPELYYRKTVEALLGTMRQRRSQEAKRSEQRRAVQWHRHATSAGRRHPAAGDVPAAPDPVIPPGSRVLSRCDVIYELVQRVSLWSLAPVEQHAAMMARMREGIHQATHSRQGGDDGDDDATAQLVTAAAALVASTRPAATKAAVVGATTSILSEIDDAVRRRRRALRELQQNDDDDGGDTAGAAAGTPVDATEGADARLSSQQKAAHDAARLRLRGTKEKIRHLLESLEDKLTGEPATLSAAEIGPDAFRGDGAKFVVLNECLAGDNGLLWLDLSTDSIVLDANAPSTAATLAERRRLLAEVNRDTLDRESREVGAADAADAPTLDRMTSLLERRHISTLTWAQFWPLLCDYPAVLEHFRERDVRLLEQQVAGGSSEGGPEYDDDDSNPLANILCCCSGGGTASSTTTTRWWSCDEVRFTIMHHFFLALIELLALILAIPILATVYRVPTLFRYWWKYSRGGRGFSYWGMFDGDGDLNLFYCHRYDDSSFVLAVANTYFEMFIDFFFLLMYLFLVVTLLYSIDVTVDLVIVIVVHRSFHYCRWVIIEYVVQFGRNLRELCFSCGRAIPLLMGVALCALFTPAEVIAGSFGAEQTSGILIMAISVIYFVFPFVIVYALVPAGYYVGPLIAYAVSFALFLIIAGIVGLVKYKRDAGRDSRLLVPIASRSVPTLSPSNLVTYFTFLLEFLQLAALVVTLVPWSPTQAWTYAWSASPNSSLSLPLGANVTTASAVNSTVSLTSLLGATVTTAPATSTAAALIGTASAVNYRPTTLAWLSQAAQWVLLAAPVPGLPSSQISLIPAATDLGLSIGFFFGIAVVFIYALVVTTPIAKQAMCKNRWEDSDSDENEDDSFDESGVKAGRVSQTLRSFKRNDLWYLVLHWCGSVATLFVVFNLCAFCVCSLDDPTEPTSISTPLSNTSFESVSGGLPGVVSRENSATTGIVDTWQKPRQHSVSALPFRLIDTTTTTATNVSLWRNEEGTSPLTPTPQRYVGSVVNIENRRSILQDFCWFDVSRSGGKVMVSEERSGYSYLKFGILAMFLLVYYIPVAALRPLRWPRSARGTSLIVFHPMHMTLTTSLHIVLAALRAFLYRRPVVFASLQTAILGLFSIATFSNKPRDNQQSTCQTSMCGQLSRFRDGIPRWCNIAEANMWRNAVHIAAAFVSLVAAVGMGQLQTRDAYTVAGSSATFGNASLLTPYYAMVYHYDVNIYQANFSLASSQDVSDVVPATLVVSPFGTTTTTSPFVTTTASNNSSNATSGNNSSNNLTVTLLPSATLGTAPSTTVSPSGSGGGTYYSPSFLSSFSQATWWMPSSRSTLGRYASTLNVSQPNATRIISTLLPLAENGSAELYSVAPTAVGLPDRTVPMAYAMLILTLATVVVTIVRIIVSNRLHAEDEIDEADPAVVRAHLVTLYTSLSEADTARRSTRVADAVPSVAAFSTLRSCFLPVFTPAKQQAWIADMQSATSSKALCRSALQLFYFIEPLALSMNFHVIEKQWCDAMSDFGTKPLSLKLQRFIVEKVRALENAIVPPS